MPVAVKALMNHYSHAGPRLLHAGAWFLHEGPWVASLVEEVSLEFSNWHCPPPPPNYPNFLVHGDPHVPNMSMKEILEK